MKKLNRGEIDWPPEMPQTEDEDSIRQHKQYIKGQSVKKDKDQDKIKHVIDVTYASRRQLINKGGPISDIVLVWPVLMSDKEMLNEFQRLMKSRIEKVTTETLKPKVEPMVYQAKSMKKTPQLEYLLKTFNGYVFV